MSGVIVVDAESFRSTWHGRDAYIHDHCLDILITMRFSINCSAVICSPTVEYLCSWEKPLVKPVAPGSLSYYIASLLFTSQLVLLFCNLYIPIYTTKIPKIFILLSLSYLTFASGREGIDNPFIALVASSQFVCVGAWDFWGASYWIDTLVLKNWGKYLRYFAASSFPLQGKTNAYSRGSMKDFWCHCQRDLRSSQDIPSTHHKPISLAFTLFAICLSFSSPPLLKRFHKNTKIFTFLFAFFPFIFSLALMSYLVCLLVCLP